MNTPTETVPLVVTERAARQAQVVAALALLLAMRVGAHMMAFRSR
jgi:hypothetical protein